MNIQEVRAKYPQYGDLSDQQLADALHSKFYADMPKTEFYSKVGLDSKERGAAAEFGVAALRGAKGVGETIAKAVTSTPLGTLLKPAVAIGEALSPDVPGPTRTDAAGKAINTAGELIGAGIAGGGAGGVRQTLANVVLPAAGGVVGEQVGGEAGKLIGSVTAPAAAQAGYRAARQAVANRAAPNVETFQQAGAQPSVGQATDSIFFRGMENLASKFPGGAGVVKKFIDAQQAAFGAKARTGVSPEAAGRAIEKGIKGFIARSKETWQRLDDAVAAKIAKDASFAPSNTVQALDDLTTPIVGAEKTTGAMVNPKVAEIKANLAADLQANNGVLPFAAMRALRSRIGAMLDDALVAGIPGGELKKLYGALSKDMEAAANKAGAGAEFTRQNNFYRARMDRIESVLERVIGKGSQPEDIFKRFMPKDPDQANQVRAVMRSLSNEERKVVTEAVVNRLGRAAPGKQDEASNIFSSETFLTNWNKLSSGAKAQLFPNHSVRQNVERIAKAAASIREGSGIYANPSGTAGAFAATTVYTSPAVGLGVAFAGGAPAFLAVLGSAAGAVALANLGSKMLTNPKVVEWLSKPVANQGAAINAHLARLVSIYNESSDPALKSELANYLESIGTTQ